MKAAKLVKALVTTKNSLSHDRGLIQLRVFTKRFAFKKRVINYSNLVLWIIATYHKFVPY